MSSAQTIPGRPPLPLNSPWPIVLAGLAALYLPVYFWAFQTIWQTEEQVHGLIVLCVLVWLIYDRWPALAAVKPDPSPALGWGVFACGLVVYSVGRVFSISILELGSQIPVAAGICLVLLGRPGLRVIWFPLIYMAFMVPLPGFFVDAVTGPLKQWISVIAEQVLYSAGYPIARHGVVLAIGQYQLLVADACSGLHSMFSLAALGLLFMYITNRKSWLHNAIMVASILPIAFVANIIRVIILILITYHMGDAAGQGFLHGGAGMVLLIAALLFLFGLDAVLARVLVSPGRSAATDSAK
jgi:exosortase B